jgi:CARDB
VSEREQTEPDGIDFDFFDDAPTQGGDGRSSPPRRRPRMPGGPSGPNTPLLRLAGLIAGGIILAVVLVLWVNACRDDQRKAKYESYMASVDKIGADSAQIGADMNELIFSSGIQLEQLQTELQGLREQQSQTVARAEALDAPGPLRQEQQHLVEALQFRVSGLNGLAQAFSQLTGAESSEETGNLLAEQSGRLIASDAVWADLFQARAQQVMDQQGVTGINVPDSKFVTNTELGSPTSWKLVVERLFNPGQQTGLRGNRIAGVRVQPGGESLSPPPAENTVHASDDLVIEVLVENSGENQETQVKVNLTIQQQPESIKGEETIESINPGDTKTVKFKISSLGTLALATRTIVKVTVEPVDGESNTNNNTAEYTVFFTLE